MKAVLIVIILLVVYVASYAFLRWSYEHEESFTYVISSSRHPRLISKVARLFWPLQKVETLLTGRPSELYRSRQASSGAWPRVQSNKALEPLFSLKEP